MRRFVSICVFFFIELLPCTLESHLWTALQSNVFVARWFLPHGFSSLEKLALNCFVKFYGSLPMTLGALLGMGLDSFVTIEYMMDNPTLEISDRSISGPLLGADTMQPWQWYDGWSGHC